MVEDAPKIHAISVVVHQLSKWDMLNNSRWFVFLTLTIGAMLVAFGSTYIFISPLASADPIVRIIENNPKDEWHRRIAVYLGDSRKRNGAAIVCIGMIQIVTGCILLLKYQPQVRK